MHDILRDVAIRFGVNINDFTKLKAAFLLDTDKDAMIVKKQFVSTEKIKACADMTDAVRRNGFSGVELYQRVCGLPYIIVNENIYTMARVGGGANCDFTVNEQTLMIARSLAQMHNASSTVDICGLWERKSSSRSYYEKRISEARHIKKWMQKQGSLTDVDVIFLKNYDRYLKNANQSIKTITEYLSQTKPHLCVNEIKEDNILINDGTATFINAEKFALSCGPVDLCELILRYIKRGGDAAFINQITQAYAQEREITDRELSFIQQYLSFPHKFFKLINKYYNSKKLYNSAFTYAKLKNCVSQQNKINNALSKTFFKLT